MAKDADVSERTIQQAKAAHAAGLGDQVRDGKLTAITRSMSICQNTLSNKVHLSWQPGTGWESIVFHV